MFKNFFITVLAFASIFINIDPSEASWNQKDQEIWDALTGRGGSSIRHTGGGMFEITTPSQPSASYSSSYHSSSSYLNQENDLKRRQDTVNKQLSEHSYLTRYNGEPTSTFYEAIKKYEQHPFEPMGGFPPITHNTDYWYQLNKDANHAKHNWKVPMPLRVDYSPKVNPDLESYIKDDETFN